MPEGSYVLKPEHFLVDLDPELDEVPVATIVRSPHLLSVGKAIAEIATSLRELQSRSCPYGEVGCALPRFEAQERRSISNAELYETLRVPATSHSTRYAKADLSRIAPTPDFRTMSNLFD